MKREYISVWGDGRYMSGLLPLKKKWDKKDFDTAARLAGWLLSSGRLDFVHGEKPRTAAEFIEGAPYISEGFEGFSGCGFRASWEIGDRETHECRKPLDKSFLSHLLLTADGCGVFVWDIYAKNGDYIKEAFEVVQL